MWRGNAADLAVAVYHKLQVSGMHYGERNSKIARIYDRGKSITLQPPGYLIDHSFVVLSCLCSVKSLTLFCGSLQLAMCLCTEYRQSSSVHTHRRTLPARSYGNRKRNPGPQSLLCPIPGLLLKFWGMTYFRLWAVLDIFTLRRKRGPRATFSGDSRLLVPRGRTIVDASRIKTTTLTVDPPHSFWTTFWKDNLFPNNCKQFKMILQEKLSLGKKSISAWFGAKRGSASGLRLGPQTQRRATRPRHAFSVPPRGSWRACSQGSVLHLIISNCS